MYLILFLIAFFLNDLAAQDNPVVTEENTGAENPEDKGKEDLKRAFTNSRQLLNDGKSEEAVLILKELANKDVIVSAEAKTLLFRVEAGMGKSGMLTEANKEEDAELRSKLLLAVGEGYFDYAGNDPSRRSLKEEGNKALDLLLRQNLTEELRTKASLLKCSHLMQLEKYDLVMRILLEVLKPDLISQPYDQGWFYLGQVLEKSTKYRDIFQARQAYQKILIIGDSSYRTTALERIEFLDSHHFVNY
jgi:hypothetical protein